ncbi:ATP-binding protein [Tepidibacillus marianensis]|uniref:sensor histidine kinase n=1 Tax=Tepidibacillus marianensis TaxID=3131995 RepID=UPI0030D537F5
MNFIVNYLLISLPEFFAVTLFAIVVYGENFHRVKRKLVYIALIGSLVSDLLWYFNIFIDFRVLITIFLSMVLYMAFLKKGILQSILMVLTSMAVLLTFEMIVAVIFTQFMSYEEIINHFNNKLLVTWSYILPIYLLSWLLVQRKFSLQNWFRDRINDKQITYQWLVVLFLVGLQLFVIVYLNYAFYMKSTFLLTKVIFNIHGLPIFSIFLIVINLLLIEAIWKLKTKYSEMEITRAENNYNQHLEGLLKKLRMERHDFMNEIQTIHGMVQAGMYSHLGEYMAQLVQHVRSGHYTVKIGNIPVNAFLYTKLGEFEEKNIEFREIVETESTFPTIKGFELVKIISNLIDNAIRAVSEGKTAGEQPYVEIYWGIKASKDIIKVSNNGPKIDKKVIDLLFEEGYTTKQQKENSGFGLAIVKSIINKYNGKIYVESTSEKTSFIIELPL